MKEIIGRFLGLEVGVEKWIYQNRFKIIRFLIAAIFLRLFSAVPYLNLIISPEYVYYLMVIAGILIFNIKVSGLIISAIFLFIVSFGFFAMGTVEIAESVGNFIYVILFFGALKAIFAYE